MNYSNDFYKTIVEEMDEGLYFVDMNRVITYWNKAAERITGFNAEEVIGRPCHENILNHVDDQGRQLCHGMCPLAYTLLDTQHREADVFLHHKNGARVPVHIKISPIIDDKGVVIGALELFSDNSSFLEMNTLVEELRRKALFDPLTKTGNRDYTNQFIDLRINEFHRYGWPFGVIFFDIDDFKHINDSFSHQVGDAVLSNAATTIMNTIRSFDFVGRIGGEEFIVIVRNIDIVQLEKRAQMMRMLVAETFFEYEKNHIAITVSGGATMMHEDDTRDSLIHRADTLMYKSKQNGKNRITVE